MAVGVARSTSSTALTGTTSMYCSSPWSTSPVESAGLEVLVSAVPDPGSPVVMPVASVVPSAGPTVVPIAPSVPVVPPVVPSLPGVSSLVQLDPSSRARVSEHAGLTRIDRRDEGRRDGGRRDEGRDEGRRDEDVLRMGNSCEPRAKRGEGSAQLAPHLTV